MDAGQTKQGRPKPDKGTVSSLQNHMTYPQREGSELNQDKSCDPSSKSKLPLILRSANRNSSSSPSETDSKVHSPPLQATDPMEDCADSSMVNSPDCQFPTRSRLRKSPILEPQQGHSVCNVAPTQYSFSGRCQGNGKQRNSSSATVDEEEHEMKYRKVRDNTTPFSSGTDEDDGHQSYDTCASYKPTCMSRLGHLGQGQTYNDDGRKSRDVRHRRRRSQTSQFTMIDDVTETEAQRHMPTSETTSEERYDHPVPKSDADDVPSRAPSEQAHSTKYDDLTWEIPVQEPAVEIKNMRVRSVLSAVSSKNICSDLGEGNEAVIQPALKPPRQRSMKNMPSQNAHGNVDCMMPSSTGLIRDSPVVENTSITAIHLENHVSASSDELSRLGGTLSQEHELLSRSAHKAVQTVLECDFGNGIRSRSSTYLQDAQLETGKSDGDLEHQRTDLPKEVDKNQRELQDVPKVSSSNQRVLRGGSATNTIPVAGNHTSSSLTELTDDETKQGAVHTTYIKGKHANVEHAKPVDKAVQVSTVHPDKMLIACSFITAGLAIALVAVFLFVLFK